MAIFLTKKHLSRRTFLRGGGVALGLPFLDAMVPAATALAQTAAAAEDARRVLLPAARRDHEQHGLRQGSRRLDLQRQGRGLQARQDHVAARALQEVRHHLREHREQHRHGLGAHAQSGHLAVVRASGHSRQGREPGHDAGPGDCAEARVRRPRCPRWNSLPRPPCRSPRAMAASTAVTTAFAAPNKPLPMEYNPRKVFIQLIGEGDTAAERDDAAAQEQQHPRHDQRAHQDAEGRQLGPRRPARAVGLPRHRPRDRAPRERWRSARDLSGSRGAGCARSASSRTSTSRSG